MLSTIQHHVINQKIKTDKENSTNGYRDRIYIIKDIILILAKYGKLNQTTLFSYCGLNLTKHRKIVIELELNGMIIRLEGDQDDRKSIFYYVTHDGLEFCTSILEPFEKMFPRKHQCRGVCNYP